ncbi:MAG: glycerophosphodiester phosphodiesterase [Eubacterium sp.]|nr:glycerophosphodiester phosphodiesterase [Eubacterium sp.]
MTKIFAHRGASGYAPENTLEAFKLAADMGADGVELDVQLTKDGQVVVCHDEKIDRTSDHKGLVCDYTLDELKSFNFNNHNPKYPLVRIPTLEEVLNLLEPTGLSVNIEMKTGIIWYPDIEQKTIDIVEKCGMKDRVVYSSFNHYSIQKLKKLDPQAETGYLYSDVIIDVEKYAKEGGVEALHPAVYHLLMSDFLKRYKESGLKIRVWTVNKEEWMEQFIREDLEAVITNYPDVALKIRNQVSEKQ